MSVILHGALTWIGDTGSVGANERNSIVPLTLSLSALDVFGGSVTAHTECNYGFYHYVYSKNKVTDEPPGVGADIRKQAAIYYRDPGTLEVLRFYYPTPIAADIERKETGDIIKDSAVVAIVGYISTMTGKSYIPLYGTYRYRV